MVPHRCYRVPTTGVASCYRPRRPRAGFCTACRRPCHLCRPHQGHVRESKWQLAGRSGLDEPRVNATAVRVRDTQRLPPRPLQRARPLQGAARGPRASLGRRRRRVCVAVKWRAPSPWHGQPPSVARAGCFCIRCLFCFASVLLLLRYLLARATPLLLWARFLVGSRPSDASQRVLISRGRSKCVPRDHDVISQSFYVIDGGAFSGGAPAGACRVSFGGASPQWGTKRDVIVIVCIRNI